MKSFTNCPVCKVPVTWTLHDDYDVYDCTNGDYCPIKFSQTCFISKDWPNPEENGLLYYTCKIGKYPIAVTYAITFGKQPLSHNTRILLYPVFHLGKLIGGHHYINHDGLDFTDLTALEQKIKTWIVFS